MPKDKETKKEKEENIKEEVEQEVEQEIQAASEAVEAAEVAVDEAISATEESVDAVEEPVESPAEAPAQKDKTNEAEPFESTVSFGEEEPAKTDGPITVQSVKFASFEDQSQAQGESNKNLDILMDIKLQLTVELGRTELPIKKVLELTRGSIIELEKVAGEPVELYANGKLVAHGEVVVIEDNFGLRITSITDPDDRLKGIQ